MPTHPGGDCRRVMESSASPVLTRPTNSLARLGMLPTQAMTAGEAIVKDRHPRWPIKRVEFYIDGAPYSYRRSAPFLLNNQEWWDMVDVAPGKHVLRVVAYDQQSEEHTSELQSLRH